MSARSWFELSRPAKTLRAAHIAIGTVGMLSVGCVWFSAVSGRHDRYLIAALTALSLQGIAIAIGRGNCPLGPLQEELGDATPCFELVLPPRAAKAAFPVLLPVTLAGVAIVAARRLPGRRGVNA